MERHIRLLAPLAFIPPRIVFSFPRLCHRRPEIGQSLSGEIGNFRQRRPRSPWARQTFSQQEFPVPTETGSTFPRDPSPLPVIFLGASFPASPKTGATLRSGSKCWKSLAGFISSPSRSTGEGFCLTIVHPALLARSPGAGPPAGSHIAGHGRRQTAQSICAARADR